MQPYSSEKEEIMRSFYNSHDEKDRRRFAGFEALQCGHGGRNYIAGVLGCSRNTVSKGAREVSGLPTKDVEQRIWEKGDGCTKKKRRIRKKGGGRKPYFVTMGAEKRDEQFLDVLREHTAGDPMDGTIRWTNLPNREIVNALWKDHDIIREHSRAGDGWNVIVFSSFS